jgi:hypothetical protein
MMMQRKNLLGAKFGVSSSALPADRIHIVQCSGTQAVVPAMNQRRISLGSKPIMSNRFDESPSPLPPAQTPQSLILWMLNG